MHMYRHSEQVEAIVEDLCSLRRSLAVKVNPTCRIYEMFANTRLVTGQEGCSAGLSLQWRKLAHQSSQIDMSATGAVPPIFELAAASVDIAGGQHVLGKKTSRIPSLKEAMEYPAEKNVDCAHVLAAPGRPANMVCRTMKLVQSSVLELPGRGESRTNNDSHDAPVEDGGLRAKSRLEMADLPSDIHRRACTLVNRQHTAWSSSSFDATRIRRVSATASILLPGELHRGQSARLFEGRRVISHSSLCWCSIGLEFRCDFDPTGATRFTKDYCDTDVPAPRARSGKLLPSEHMPKSLTGASESYLSTVGSATADTGPGFLSDHLRAFVAPYTGALACSRGLNPVNTPASIPKSRGMTESDAPNVKRYYVAHLVPHEARAALPLLPEAFEHCNEVHPHSTLKHALVSKVNAAAGYVQGPEASDLLRQV